MNPICRLILIMLCLSWVAGSAYAQRMPQDSWYLSHTWGSSGSGDGQFNEPRAVAVSSDGLVYVVDSSNHRIQVFEQDGTFIRKWGNGGSGDGQFSYPMGIAISPDGYVYVVDANNYRIQVFEQDGTFIRKWGSRGSGDGQFSRPIDVSIGQNNRVYVLDSENARVQAFSLSGDYLLSWGEEGELDGQFSSWNLAGITTDHMNRVYVAQDDYSGRAIQVFDPDGKFIRKFGADVHWRSGGLVVSPNSGRLFVSRWGGLGIYELDGTMIRSFELGDNYTRYIDTVYRVAMSRDGNIVLSGSEYIFSNGDWTQVFKIYVFKDSSYRLPFDFGAVPQPQVLDVSQRSGTPYLDVDYIVWDSDSSHVKVALAAFENGLNSLSNYVTVSSFEEGSEIYIGSNVLANTTNRVTWNVSADLQAEYVNLKVRVMAQDDRGLMSIGFITLPADVDNSLSALTISQSPITQFDMLPLWYWLLATKDAAIELRNGAVYGVGGTHDNIILAQNISTTPAGRAFLFDRLGVREATAAEYSRARMGASGVLNQWPVRAGSVTAGPGDRPRALNDYGFDTGNWGSDGWWVVPQ